MPVLFSAGTTETAVTRATAAYMPKDSRFVCSMFFYAGANDADTTAFYTGTPTPEVNMATRSLIIENELGSAKYENSNSLYWQNRRKHIFLALADNNKLGDTTLKLYPDVTTKVGDDYMLSYDLTRGEKTAMSEQPDPIQAIVKMSPAGATAESNRVKLFFKHQFAQIQVNLKGSQNESAIITDAQIDSVELIGVAETGYVGYCINEKGEVPATDSKTINVDNSFCLFERGSVPTGYLKSFEGIAFGTLHGIRITWRESADRNSVKHVATFKGIEKDKKKLKSGMKYVYNMELRRSTIAQVSANITAWEEDPSDYNANGTIDKNQ